MYFAGNRESGVASRSGVNFAIIANQLIWVNRVSYCNDCTVNTRLATPNKFPVSPSSTQVATLACCQALHPLLNHVRSFLTSILQVINTPRHNMRRLWVIIYANIYNYKRHFIQVSRVSHRLSATIRSDAIKLTENISTPDIP